MMELNAYNITSQGFLEVRHHALVDVTTAKLANAKNPLRWPDMFRYRAAFCKTPVDPTKLPQVRIAFPDRDSTLSTEEDLDRHLTHRRGRQVKLIRTSAQIVQFEGYIWRSFRTGIWCLPRVLCQVPSLIFYMCICLQRQRSTVYEL